MDTNFPVVTRRGFLQGVLGGGMILIPCGALLGTALAQPSERASSRMQTGEPSATALGAAVHRALHQVLDYPRILDDPFALPILGAEGAMELQSAADRQSRGLRASIAMRSRYAEDRLLAAAVDARGVRQYVVLGAGLDTYAYRNPHASLGLRVFEVDHPATQRWKRERLSAARIAVPPLLTFVPIDFETQLLPQQLAAAAFHFDQPAFFSLLGVVIYLSKSATAETLRVVSACAPGSEIVFSFSLPDDYLTEAQRRSRVRSMKHMEALGEPWLNFYEPAALVEELYSLGFSAAEPFTPAEANRTYFSGRGDGLRITGGGHMMAAQV